ncbi:Hypothetical protein NATL1_08821 [Prochlorococcus marinus str. NATL1A]|uniref:Outer membrane protein beta-barrel domain-containing protein n=2 Tax=Prochlorococcus marinus TaxID=1219 RepID=A2C1T0_PROM1|nr:Hypothetical protein NATL1_08821 [Prochlorococcus marinus str. NATL1A]
MKNLSIKIVRFVMTTFILNYGLIYPTLSEEKDNALEVNNINNKKNKTAIEVSVGSFHPGPYAPYQLNKKKWNNCNTLNFCDLNNLFGKSFGVTYIKRFHEKNNRKVDIDSSITFSSQKYSSKDNSYLMFSIVPTYRYYPKNIGGRLNLGIGVGLNLASRDIPSESKDNENLNTQLNLEIAYRINKKTSSDLVMGIKHRCTLFGIIGGKLRGSQWFTIGLRKWY